MLRIAATVLFWLLSLAIATVLTASLLPFVDTRWWLVRLLDFPHLQFGIVTLALLLLLPCFSRHRPRAVLALAAAAVVALGADALVLWPYRPSAHLATASDACPADRRLAVMISNVLLTNRQSQTLLDEVRAERPDLFLAMEVDDWWDRTLQPLSADMPYGATKVTGSYYGMRLFSRLPLSDTDVRFLAGRDTPSIVTTVKLRDGEDATFLGIHPRPPLVGQSALPRDAELYAAAQILRGHEGPAVMAGDLNATPWEDAVQRTRRIAGRVSPRQGHGYVYSFDAKSWWAKWPFDQIDYKPGFTALSLDRLAPIGSDHYPYVVRLCRDPFVTAPAAVPEGEDDRERVDEADRAARAAAGSAAR
ncbi:endonuclease/exonuclease/phosphatase family protein [Lichenibacterium dinghuense]|uniref:endonuclease/exonuclease/phosphatase family protein n=1 Tax=Lichenibacterium dinghuense TaxID=2895977 RepID=UPI001F38722C|nr:endonuclease/exonuclease/phosphatase family protein [Lichenibacterium sp. 6Y81]